MSGTQRAWAWVAHLRAGGTLPWHAFEAPSEPLVPGTGRLPGAAQLEVLRRLTLVAGEPVDDRLADAVLAASAPGRGQPDLALTGVGDGTEFGPPPADPLLIDPAELLRLAAGLLGDRLTVARPSDHALPPRRLRVPWRDDHRIMGPPALADSVRAALDEAGHRRGRRTPLVVLVADGLDALLADIHRWRLTQGATPRWDWWLGHWAQRDALPPRADLLAIAHRWAERVGADRVHVVLGPTPAPVVGELLGTPTAHATVDGLSPAACEVLRSVNAVLRIATPPEESQRLRDEVLLPALAPYAGPVRAVPRRHRDWVTARAADLGAGLLEAGYAVHGDPAVLAAETAGAAAPTADEALDLALRTLLDLKEGAR